MQQITDLTKELEKDTQRTILSGEKSAQLTTQLSEAELKKTELQSQFTKHEYAGPLTSCTNGIRLVEQLSQRQEQLSTQEQPETRS